MPILPERIQKNGNTLNPQISPSDEASVIIVPIAALAQPFQWGDRLRRGWNVDIFSMVCCWRSKLCTAAQIHHLSIIAPPFNGQKQGENLELQNLH